MLSLNNWWHSLNGLEQVFWAIALIFTILFLIQFVLSIIGLGVDSDVDMSGHLDTDLHGDMPHDYTVDPSFTLFSVRSVIAFFTAVALSCRSVPKSLLAITLSRYDMKSI